MGDFQVPPFREGLSVPLLAAQAVAAIPFRCCDSHYDRSGCYLIQLSKSRFGSPVILIVGHVDWGNSNLVEVFLIIFDPGGEVPRVWVIDRNGSDLVLIEDWVRFTRCKLRVMVVRYKYHQGYSLVAFVFEDQALVFMWNGCKKRRRSIILIVPSSKPENNPRIVQKIFPIGLDVCLSRIIDEQTSPSQSIIAGTSFTMFTYVICYFGDEEECSLGENIDENRHELQDQIVTPDFDSFGKAGIFVNQGTVCSHMNMCSSIISFELGFSMKVSMLNNLLAQIAIGCDIMIIIITDYTSTGSLLHEPSVDFIGVNLGFDSADQWIMFNEPVANLFSGRKLVMVWTMILHVTILGLFELVTADFPSFGGFCLVRLVYDPGGVKKPWSCILLKTCIFYSCMLLLVSLLGFVRDDNIPDFKFLSAGFCNISFELGPSFGPSLLIFFMLWWLSPIPLFGSLWVKFMFWHESCFVRDSTLNAILYRYGTLWAAVSFMLSCFPAFCTTFHLLRLATLSIKRSQFSFLGSHPLL